MRQKFQQTVITLFDTEIMVSGSNQGDNELANWQEIAPGSYTFPFALKVPNVNFPPCIPVSSFCVAVSWLFLCFCFFGKSSLFRIAIEACLDVGERKGGEREEATGIGRHCAF